MRPLIEILEDERTLTQKLDMIYRYLIRTDDHDSIDILEAKQTVIECDLNKTRNELKECLEEILR